MKLTAQEARQVVGDDSFDFELIESEIVDTSRWSVHKEGIFKHIKTGKFYRFEWSEGATEMQEEMPYEYETEVEPEEVEQVEVKSFIWKAI